MHRLQLMKREEGYTLFEAILQVVIFALFAQLFVLFFYWKGPIEQRYKNRSTIAWEMFALDLQEEIRSTYSIEIIRGGEGIRLQTNQGIIAIEEKNKVIRKSVGGLGHVPFITEVDRTNFTLDGAVLHVEVVMEDGSEMERDFIVGRYAK